MRDHDVLLREIHGKQIVHGAEGNLVEHLKGTFRILTEWSCPPDVCSAGLFHSSYGTDHLQGTAIDIDDRARLQTELGTEAEQLVWLFCIMVRNSLISNDVGQSSFFIQRRDTGEKASISRAQCSGLMHLLAANALEQLPRREGKQQEVYRAEARSQLLSIRPWLNSHAQQRVDQYLQQAGHISHSQT